MIQLVGLSHRTAPLALRERLARPPGEAYPLLKAAGFPEAVLLSTCNRAELYLGVPETRSEASLREAFARLHGIPPAEVADTCYVRAGDGAIRHAFEVVAGLDSVALGETQVLGQAKEAYCLALEHGMLGTELHALFQQAFATAKRIHTETAVGQRRVSVSSVAVALAGRIFQDLSQQTALVIGAGEMSDLTVRHLGEAGVRRLLIVNRSPERALPLGGEALGLEDLPQALARADIVIASAGGGTLIGAEMLREALRQRRQRPLFLIDIALPRNVDPAAKSMDNVYAYDLDDLERVVEDNLKGRAEALLACGPILDDAVRDCLHAQAVRSDLQPVITALRDRLHALRDQELGRLPSSLPAEARAATEEAWHRLVNKILHDPIEALKREAREGDGSAAAEAVRRLFGLRP